MAVELSEVTFHHMLDCFITKYFEHPETRPSFDLDNVIYDDEDNKEDALKWFEDNHDAIFKRVFHTYPFLVKEEEEESSSIAYALYISYLYQSKKAVPLTLEEFKEKLPLVNSKLELEFVYGGDVAETFYDIESAERVVIRELEIKEAIERCVTRDKPLIEQEEEIEKIIQCFLMKYDRHVDLVNKIFSACDHFEISDPLCHTFYHFMNRNGIVLRLGMIQEEIPYEDLSTVLNEAYSPTIDNGKEDGVKRGIQYNREYAENYWFIRKKFIEHGKDTQVDYGEYAIDNEGEEENSLVIRFNNTTKELKFVGENFFRLTGEEVLDFDAIVHEVLSLDKELSGKREEIEEHARKHFYNFLTEEQKKQYALHQGVYVEGKDFDYIIHSKSSYNNIIQIQKDETRAALLMCVTPVDANISKYDTKATAVMLINAGKEEVLNDIANFFPTKEKDEEIIQLFSA